MNSLPKFLTEQPKYAPLKPSHELVRIPFLEKGIHYLARVVQDAYAHWEGAQRDGFLQKLDPRIKVLFLALALVVVSLKRELAPQAGIGIFIFGLFLSARLDILPLYRRILTAGLLFGVLVPLPSILNIFTGGTVIVPLLQLPHDFQHWGIHLPARIGVTREGLFGMALMTLRVSNSVALSLLILHTTAFPSLMKALRVFRVPDSFIAVITLSYKYVFAFTRTVHEMHLAKKSRLVRRLDGKEARRWTAGRIAFLFQRTQNRCEEIFKAMISRGFEHDGVVHTFKKLSGRDWGSAAAAAAILGCFLIW